MKYQYDGLNWLVRLDRGERLSEQLTAIAEAENIKSAWVSGIGATQYTEIGFYDLEQKKYKSTRLNQLLEITSLTGNLSKKEGKPFLHLHIVLSDDEFRTYGGHLLDLEAAGTVEVFLHNWQKETLIRRFDQDSGLSILDL